MKKAYLGLIIICLILVSCLAVVMYKNISKTSNKNDIQIAINNETSIQIPINEEERIGGHIESNFSWIADPTIPENLINV